MLPLIPKGAGQVKDTGNSRATVRTGTQRDAVTIAREIARNHKSECFNHGKTVKSVPANLMETILTRLKAK